MNTVISIPANSKIFILEDNQERRDFFWKHLNEHHRLVFAADADTAIKYLANAKQPYDVMFLDHDLTYAEQSFTSIPTHSNTGSAVAKSIVENGWLAKHVIIHSWNPVGAQNMAKVLGPSVLVIPFGSFSLQTF